MRARDLVFHKIEGNPPQMNCNYCGHSKIRLMAEVPLPDPDGAGDDPDAHLSIVVCSYTCAKRYKTNPASNEHLKDSIDRVQKSRGKKNRIEELCDEFAGTAAQDLYGALIGSIQVPAVADKETFSAAAAEINSRLIQLAHIRSLVGDWVTRRGHDRCWHYPEIFGELAKTLGIDIPQPDISRDEFEAGCQRFWDELYGELQSTDNESKEVKDES